MRDSNVMRYHILECLQNNGSLRDFHMPGHKAEAEFSALFAAAPFDVTELPYSDDLQCPRGPIALAQRDIAEITGADSAFITTDGSSSGVMALMVAAAKRGKKIVVFRNSHKSVYNACKIFGLEPVIAEGKEEGGLLLPPSPEEVERACSQGDIAGVMATSPDYYGNLAPLREYAEIAHKHGGILLVDGAHGAHLAFEENRRGYAGVYADAWVDGAHKNLPALTQGAAVLCRGALAEDIAEGLSVFRTTSPSYPIMASVEYGYKYLRACPERILRAKEKAQAFKERFACYPSGDWAKLALDCKALGISPEEIVKRLQLKGIYPEMNDARYVLFYLSPLVSCGAFERLSATLAEICSDKALQKTYREVQPYCYGKGETIGYLKALASEWEYVPLARAEGRICAENAGITPPCVPLIVAGERITRGAIRALQGGKNTFGVAEGRIKAVKL